MPVSLKGLRKHWTDAGLRPASLPADPRSLYLFKRAMREQEGKHTNLDGTAVERTVVDLLETGDHCIYQISLVVRDVDQRQVEYPKAMRVVYSKSDGELQFDPLGEVDPKYLRPIKQAIEQYMEENTKVVDGRKVRTLVRNFLKDELDGENLRGKAGGVYFVRQGFHPMLTGLASALGLLYRDDAEVYGLTSIPLANGPAEREMIRRHFTANNLKEIGEATSDVIKLLRGDRKNVVRQDVIAHHWERQKALMRRAHDYAELLIHDKAELRTNTPVFEALETLHDTLSKLG
jgi:hypothetical protein